MPSLALLFSLDVIDLAIWDAVIEWYVWLVVDGQRETRVRRGEAHRALQFEYRRIGQALPRLLHIPIGRWFEGKRMIRADEPLEADEPPAEERDDDGIFQKTTRMDPSAFSCHSAATRPAGTSITNFPVREQRTVPSPRRKTESHSTRTCKPSPSIC